jgi:type I restriction enzyme M protein
MFENNKRAEVDFIWRITDDVLRNIFKKNEIGDVLLPFVVIRRLDCILEPYNKKVREEYEKFREKITEDKLDPILKKAAGSKNFYNISKHNLNSLKDEPQNIEINFNNYINGFNPEVREILENFHFDKVLARLIKNRVLYQMIDAICKIDLHENKVDNHDMGYVFEEMIRISNEQSNETAGEHFTPRDVVALMCTLLFDTDKEVFKKEGVIRTIFDPTMGTGGMTNLGKTYVLDYLCKDQKQKPTIRTFGQELNEQSYAIAKSEALITGEDANNFKLGNSLTNDQFQGKQFHYMMANPPYGVTWKIEQEYVLNESMNPLGRFFAGTPRSSDGQLLFLQHMISKMEKDGSRIGVVTNGSPLFTGDAGSGESDIRKWIIENDWLECIVGLPKDMFYNTGINTYIWFITNKKDKKRKGKIQLIDATLMDDKSKSIVGFCQSNKKSLGNKRNEITDAHIAKIKALYENFEVNKFSKIFDNDDFGFYQLTVEQPLYDEKGKILKDKNKNPKADSKKRDKENVPLKADVETYFKEEVLPHVPDAWIDYDKTRIGYEINFTKYFYEYTALRSSAELQVEINALEFGSKEEKGITELLKELLG